MLKVVFFDAAGTLFDAREPVAVSYARLARRYGVAAEVSSVAAGFHRAFSGAPGLAFGPGRQVAELRELERSWWRERVRDTFTGLGTFSDFDAYFTELFAFFADPANWALNPDVPALLAGLRRRGLRLGIISNFDYRIYRVREALGLRSCLDSVTISSEAGYAKPAAEIFQTALARHAVLPAAAMHVGDSGPLDLAGAANAGLAAVLLDPGLGAPMRVSGRTACVSSLRLVPEVICRLKNP